MYGSAPLMKPMRGTRCGVEVGATNPRRESAAVKRTMPARNVRRVDSETFDDQVS